MLRQRCGSTVLLHNKFEAWFLGQDPKRQKVHSSMYAKLRTNLPREVMAYTDFAFDDLAGHSQDARRFPSHHEVGAACNMHVLALLLRDGWYLNYCTMSYDICHCI